MWGLDVVNDWLTTLKASATEIQWTEIITALLIFFFFLILRKLFTKYVFKMILAFTKKTRTNIDQHIAVAFERPVRVMFIFVGLFLSLGALGFDTHYGSMLSQLFRTSMIFLVTWGLWELSGNTAMWFEELGERFRFKLDDILVPLLSKTIKVVILGLALSVAIQEWGFDISGFIAGLGLGGLAFALAAKDAVANIFGGIVIITEKPFSIGDWIDTPSVEGTVEDITFRSTRVRTFAQALVTVPNSKLADEPITNWSRMGRRRITYQLGVKYTTPRHKLKTCVNRIRDMLQNDPAIDQRTLFVHFDKFGVNSLEIFLYFFTKTTNWGEWLKAKESCNLKIMEILEEEGVEVALPSTSVYFETPLKQAGTESATEQSGS